MWVGCAHLHNSAVSGPDQPSKTGLSNSPGRGGMACVGARWAGGALPSTTTAALRTVTAEAETLRATPRGPAIEISSFTFDGDLCLVHMAVKMSLYVQCIDLAQVIEKSPSIARLQKAARKPLQRTTNAAVARQIPHDMQCMAQWPSAKGCVIHPSTALRLHSALCLIPRLLQLDDLKGNWPNSHLWQGRRWGETQNLW